MATYYNIEAKGVSQILRVNTGSQGLQGERGLKGDTGVGISSIDVKESSVNEGNNVVTINLSDNTSKSFNIKNGSKGDKGENTVAITEVSATIDENTGTPTVECVAGGTPTERTLTFNFHNLKGERGVDGRQGIVGETGNGISSITVSESTVDEGDNVITVNMTDGSSKSFTVKNGSKGDKGENTASISNVSATVDNEIGTPSVDCVLGGTPTERTITLNFHNLKGEVGNNGKDGVDGKDGEVGAKGDTGNGISSITVSESAEDSGSNVVTISMTDGTSKSFTVKNGSKGSTGENGKDGNNGTDGKDGVGISSINVSESTADEGNNVVTINLSDNTSKSFNVKNGSKGSVGETGAKGDTGLGISSIDVTESTEDEGNNVVKITLSDNTAKTFNIKNGSKGSTGEVGAKGDTGTSAGFGTPTATVDNEIGTPSVEVTASGEDTAKVFNFSFHNLKGEKGADGTNGTTPVKGTDYWTSEDKTEIVNDVVGQVGSSGEEYNGSSIEVYKWSSNNLKNATATTVSLPVLNKDITIKNVQFEGTMYFYPDTDSSYVLDVQKLTEDSYYCLVLPMLSKVYCPQNQYNTERQFTGILGFSSQIIVEIPKIKFVNCTFTNSVWFGDFYEYSAFENCNFEGTLRFVNFKNGTSLITKNYQGNYIIKTEWDLSNFNTQNVTNMSNIFYACDSLTSLTLGADWGSNTSITSFALSSCPLTHDSCLDVFNKLADKTQTATTSATLTLNSTTKALMSADEIKIATDKGWTVS